MGNGETHQIQTIIHNPPFDGVEESSYVKELLTSELLYISELIHAHPQEQRLRRIFVRSLFAYIEGSAFRLKQDALKFGKFPAKEIPFLRERESRLNDRGEVSEADMRIPTLQNLYYSFCAFGKACGVDGTLDKSHHRWDSLKKALKIRHRIYPSKILNGPGHNRSRMAASYRRTRLVLRSAFRCPGKSYRAI